MISKCSLAGYPSVIRVSIDQPSDATPGRIVVDCTMPPLGDSLNLPKRTTLRITGRRFDGTWNLVQLSGPKPVIGMHSVYRFIFADDRYDMAQKTMPIAFNARDASGVIADADRKSTAFLWTQIAERVGLTIDVKSAPLFNAPAPWAGRTALECANELLTMTGSRMVYDPIAQKYIVQQGDKGQLPDVSSRLLQQVQSVVFNKLRVESAPTLFEGEIKARASWINATGAIENLPSPVQYFLGYPDEADKVKRNRLVQSGFRIWKPLQAVGTDGTVTWPNFAIIDQRCVVVATAAQRRIHESMKLPHQAGKWNVSGDGNNQRIRYWRDSSLITTDMPAIQINDAGKIQTDAVFIGCFYAKDSETWGGYKCRSKEFDLLNDEESGDHDKVIVINNINPLSSTQDDAPTDTGWQTLVDEIATAIRPLYMNKPQEIGLPALIPNNGCGRIARSSWHVSFGGFGRSMKLSTRFTIDYPDQSLVQTIGAIS